MKPTLSSETAARVSALFASDERSEATELLVRAAEELIEMSGYSDPAFLERLQIAALKVSKRDLVSLRRLLNWAEVDWRDLLVTAGFANDVRAHLRWKPSPQGGGPS